ncbi:LOW QUALITY PROTEIN: carotenoid 9,10(9',10')-cleavage dioxygenase-like [Phalaenopsis equestris]|uniref:LOW QUALITY PROTEIN: carotenoid 9,10(9',10')-cleavage dioxygenase-like n=1 Tax=Phalaenopsis equestris TaxID=78828 RepID=UPI0009E54036|nr:LOW QUALITY PROTEIN: carotenoid 9,10(9',10')-cleavage dioxygenase-like [Phalaenopsis equestris]
MNAISFPAGAVVYKSGNSDQNRHRAVSKETLIEVKMRNNWRSSAARMSAIPGVLPIQPTPWKSFLSASIDLMERVVVKLTQDSSLSKHNLFLAGNFAPVAEETPPRSDLAVRGSLPECLNGEFVRVGPNPKFLPVSGYHWFDGDGMIHGLRIKNGKATYVARYVMTSKLNQEEYFGAAKFTKIGDLKGLFGLFMVQMKFLREKLVLDVSYGTGTANTALIYHHGKLLALHENDKPYVIKVLEDGDLQTLGTLDYDKRLTHTFTAHPKVDPKTGEMFTFGNSLKPPYLTYRVISKDGVMFDPVPITIDEPVLMHDFAITENYAIFMDLPLCFRPKELVKGKMAFSFDCMKKARFGILPRYAKDENQIRWFELPSCLIFHNANAWEEGDEVVLITCHYEKIDFDLFNGAVRDETETTESRLYLMRFNMKTGAATQKQLSAPTIEFPRINESFMGRKQRYVYSTIVDNKHIKGIIKFDLLREPVAGTSQLEVGGNVEAIYELGPGRFGSEAIFVPRTPATAAEEDDGYLIFFVHDENSGKSEVNVVDAKTLSPELVAAVELPSRVPFGFHALFVNEEQLQIQQS